ncbi:MAG: Crp/Fnr family transcriptional regulator [Arcicella sp.]|jgi:CRP-like cAMP-binding protein|nr:Crp/Fnr family transcriptional regulator [Arcicella sp.]
MRGSFATFSPKLKIFWYTIAFLDFSLQIYFQQFSLWVGFAGVLLSCGQQIRAVAKFISPNSKALCKGLIVSKLTLKLLQNHHNAGRWNNKLEMTTNFFNIINTILPLKDDIAKNINQIVHVGNIPKGTLLLVEGQVSDKLYFLCSGMARAFYYDNGEEITSWIVSNNDFIYSAYSFIQQKPSYESIQILEDSIVLSIKLSDLENLYKKFPETSYIALKITERYMLLYDERVRSLRLSAIERYQRFQNQYPHIVSKVKTHYLASYLGMSRSCLHLLRSKKLP